MATYMKIEGIEGNVTAEGHEKWIEIHSFSFGVGRGIARREPGRTENRESSSASLSEVSISKEMDETSPLLFTQACIGDGKEITVDFCRTGENPQIYMQYILSNTLISSYSVKGGGDGAYENLTLNFDKIVMKYNAFDDKHKQKTSVPAGYDLTKAKKV